ncbi:MAG TPA: CUAEP/CCAEP-tail radical SAM protein, partial [Polyangiaceae bacterium]
MSPSVTSERSGKELTQAGAVLLVSCYELGHQSFSIASAWAQLQEHGYGVAVCDVSLQPLDENAVRPARLVAISVPMHTALRLGVEVAKRVRHLSGAHISMFGLYAWMNGIKLLDECADSVIGGEFEPGLLELAGALSGGGSLAELRQVSTRASLAATGALRPPVLERIAFSVPERRGPFPIARYAKLVGPEPHSTRLAGYVEASRGCKHRCRHCPVVPVYDGRFFVVQKEVVLADARQQIAAGARHITFGDPDFLNGVGHALSVVRSLHQEFPEVSFDVTVKVEHIIRHRAVWDELRGLGCVFVVSAVESLSDRVLAVLEKGHTRADVFTALDILRQAGVALRPSFVAFTPWTTLQDYIDLVEFIYDQELVEHVDPIQLSIRLLVPPGSALLWPKSDSPRPAGTRPLSGLPTKDAEPPDWLGPFDPEELNYVWRHPDQRMDRLHQE